jgi:hypothetical protein
VLAYPSPTALRFVVFLAALLSAGAFVGTWLHNQLLFDDWPEVVVRCEAQALAPTRTAVLAITAQLVSSALLRSREHDADLRLPGAVVELVAAVAAAVRDLDVPRSAGTRTASELW